MNHTFDLMKRLSLVAMSGEGVLQPLAVWIVDNRDRFPDMSLSQVATTVDVSETTVFRLAKTLGFSGFREMRMAMAELRGVATGHRLKDQIANVDSSDPYSAIVKNTVNVHTSNLRTTAQLIDLGGLQKAVTALQNAKAVHVFGFGSSAAPVMDLYQRLVRFGYVTSQYSDPHVLTAVTSNPPHGSLFLAISYSGQSKDVVDGLRSASKQGLQSILITSNINSSASEFADIVLQSAPSGALVGSESVASRVSQLAIIDMICTALALEHPRKNEFLRNANALEEEIEMKRVHKSEQPATYSKTEG
ncbi:MAG: MurR/RpiR family transcriptional regulator [Pseudomonadota bacterium]